MRESIRPSFPKEQQSFQGPACGSSGKLKSKKFSQHVSNKKDEDEEVNSRRLCFQIFKK